MAGEKPALRIFGKRKSGEGPEYVDIGAFWRNERGLSGKWDRRVVAVKFEDGTVVKLADYYLNAREVDAGQARPSTARKPAADPFGDDAPPPTDADDFPF